MSGKDDLEEGEVAVDTLEPDLQDEVKLQKKKPKVKKIKTKTTPPIVPESPEPSKTSTTDSFEKIEKKFYIRTENRPNLKKGKNEFTSSTYKTKPCEFYRKGSCQRGNDCSYSHDFPVERLNEVCKFHLTGNCLKGDNCVFSHDLSKYPCKFFWGTGHCNQSVHCRFSHELPQDERKIMEFIEDNEDFFMSIHQKYGKTNLGNHFVMYLQRKAAEQNKEQQRSQFLLLPPTHDQTNYHNPVQNPHFNQNAPPLRSQPIMEQSGMPPHMRQMPHPGMHGKSNLPTQPGYFDPNINTKNQFMQPPPPIQNFQQKPVQFTPMNNHPSAHNYQQRPVQHNQHFPQNPPFGHQGPYNQPPINQHHPNLGMNYPPNNTVSQGPPQNMPQHIQPQMQPHLPHMIHHQQFPQKLEDPKPLLVHPMQAPNPRNDHMAYNMQNTMNNQPIQTHPPVQNIQPMQSMQHIQSTQPIHHPQLAQNMQSNQHIHPGQPMQSMNNQYNRNFQENPAQMQTPQPQSADPRRRLPVPSVTKQNFNVPQPENMDEQTNIQQNNPNNHINPFIPRGGPQTGNMNPFLVQSSSINQLIPNQREMNIEDTKNIGSQNDNPMQNIFLPNKELENNTSKNNEKLDRPAPPSQYNAPKENKSSPMKSDSRPRSEEKHMKAESSNQSILQNTVGSTSITTSKNTNSTITDDSSESKPDFWSVVKSRKVQNVKKKSSESEAKPKEQTPPPPPSRPSKMKEELKKPEVKKLFDQKALFNTLGVSMKRESRKNEGQSDIDKLFSTLEFHYEKTPTPIKNSKEQIKTSISDTIKSLRGLLASND